MARLVIVQAGNRTQIVLENKLTVKGGFSGCPVFANDTDAVLGMIVTADEGNNLAFMAPSDFLTRQLKFEEPRRGTHLWKIHFFRRNILTALLDDLYSFEGQGYDDMVCERVRTSLGSVANAISVIDDRAYWSKGLDDEVEDFVSIYKMWNGYPKGKGGAEERNSALRRLREKRRSISSKIKQAQGLLGLEQDQEMIDEIFNSIRAIVGEYPGQFSYIEKTLKTLNDRSAG